MSKSHKSEKNSISKSTKANSANNIINIRDSSRNMYKVPNYKSASISDQPEANRTLPNSRTPMTSPGTNRMPSTPGTMPMPSTPGRTTSPDTTPGTRPGTPTPGTSPMPSTPGRTTPPGANIGTPPNNGAPRFPTQPRRIMPGASPRNIQLPSTNTPPNHMNFNMPNNSITMPYINYGTTPNNFMQMSNNNQANCPCMPNPMLMSHPSNSYLGIPILPLYGYDNSTELDQDVNYIKQLYPTTVRSIQKEVEDECDKLEYDGSFIYDEYPDKASIDRVIDRIYERIRDVEDEPVEASHINHRSRGRRNNVRDIISLILLNELLNRRRHYRSRRRWF